MYNQGEAEHAAMMIKENLPKIDGVEWDVYIDRSYESDGYRVSIVSRFSVDAKEPLFSKMGEIGRKVHEIVSGGQVKLELE